MAELFRHTDEDGYAISIYSANGHDGLVVDVWPEHAEHRLGSIDLRGDASRRLLAALFGYYGPEEEH